MNCGVRIGQINGPWERGKSNIELSLNLIHAYFKFRQRIDSDNVRLFDLGGIHPKIICGPHAKSWISYPTQDFDFIANSHGPDPFRHALTLSSAREAMDYLASKRPAGVVKYGLQVERTIRARLAHAYQSHKPWWELQCTPLPLSICDATKTANGDSDS